MTLRLVGAGFPRTGTRSLTLALEQLLGGRCYHMHEVFENLDHVPVWRQALRGDMPDWNEFLAGYVAAVDWPASAFWPQLAEANPDAIVVLSQRDDAATWWRSADADHPRRSDARTSFPSTETGWRSSTSSCEHRIGERWDDAATAMAAYERNNADVRARVPSRAPRRVAAGRRLGADLHAHSTYPCRPQPFPHVNTTAEWTAQQ